MGNSVRDKAKQKFVELLAQPEGGGNISYACKAIGYSRQAIADWRRGDANFDDAVNDAILVGRDNITDIAEEALANLVRKGNVTAIIFTLKSLRPERWADKRPYIHGMEEQTNTGWEADTDHKRAFLLWMRTLLAKDVVKSDILASEEKQALSRIFDKVVGYAKDELNAHPD